MYRFNQHSFVGGQLDRGLMGRQDLERYFQGASKLENFIVRKQGNIIKRRGTEMMADLGDLFGTGENIAYSRIIPFSYEITGGYYLLLAESSGDSPKRGGFILSDLGLQHKIETVKVKLDESGNETDTRESVSTMEFMRRVVHDSAASTETLDDGSVWNVTSVTEPFRMEVPYSGAEFDAIGCNQSGDTLFLAHKRHPPATVVNNIGYFTYQKIAFSEKRWKKPKILNVESTNFKGTGAAKSVSYVCTYVKDGFESECSDPFTTSYALPWNAEAIMKITCDKGNNEEEPDYYNVYKKDSSEYGIISTIGAPITIHPEIYNKDASPITPVLYYNQTSTAQLFARDVSTYYSYNPLIFIGRVAGYSQPYPDIIGGALCEDGIVTLDFGESSGTRLTYCEIQLDAFWAHVTRGRAAGRAKAPYTIRYERKASGTYFEAKATFRTADGDVEKTKSARVELKDFSPLSLAAGNTAGAYVTNPYIEGFNRSAIFDFTEEINADTTLKSSKSWEIRKIEITFYSDDTADKIVVPAYFRGVLLKNSIDRSNVTEDDHITPNIAYTPPQNTAHFDKVAKFPSCVSMYTQRLAFASTQDQPFTWWMSCVGDLYNFNTHASIRQDDAMEVTVPATEFPSINHMVLSRDLILFCDNGEWLVRPLTGNTLAYDTVECKKQSAIGCAKSVPPLQVGDEIIFADNSKRVIRSIKYQFSSDGYESNDLSILSQSIFFTNPVVSMCYKQHPESLILCELTDGSVAALVYMKEHNVIAWTRHSLGGGWKCRGIASNKAHADETTHVAMLVEKDDGSTEIWRVRDDDESEDLSAQLCMDGLRFALGSELGEAAFGCGQIVVDLTTGEIIARVDDLDADREYAVGYPFTSTFVSVRPEPQGSETFQWELKNAKKVNIRTLNGSSFTVKEAGMSDAYASVVDIERVIENGAVNQPGLVDKFDILLNGENSRDGRIEIKHDGILPLTIESFSIDYETQPLYGSEG